MILLLLLSLDSIVTEQFLNRLYFTNTAKSSVLENTIYQLVMF